MHTQDIAVPLGRKVTAPTESVLVGLDLAATPKAIRDFHGPSLTSLRLTATDSDWSHGDGEEIAGASLDLLLLLTGRPVVLNRLSGPGVPTLTARLAA